MASAHDLFPWLQRLEKINLRAATISERLHYLRQPTNEAPSASMQRSLRQLATIDSRLRACLQQHSSEYFIKEAATGPDSDKEDSDDDGSSASSAGFGVGGARHCVALKMSLEMA